MRDLGYTGPSRIKGRAALVKRLRGLLLALERFGRHRATSRDDLNWAGHLRDVLLAALRQAEGQDQR